MHCLFFRKLCCLSGGNEATYPKIDFQVAGTTEFPVAYLECDGHLVILVQLLVEALSAVSRKLDVVGHSC